jgi:hypothetical protein
MFRSEILSAGRAPLYDPVAEGAEGEAGQGIRPHPHGDEDRAVLLDPVVGTFDLALQAHRFHRFSASAQPRRKMSA